MRITNRVDGLKLAACLGAACVLAAAQGMAQIVSSGVAHPDPAVITTTDDTAAPSTPQGKVKPSAAIPETKPTEVYGPYVPYRAGGTAQNAAPAPVDPDAGIVTEATAGQDQRRLLSAPAGAKGDPDAGIVTYVPAQPGEIPEGTLVRAKLREDLSTLTTQPGTKFTAELTEPVMREGKVIVPVGAVLEGRVTLVRGGKRIGGPAAIHLEPRTVTLPDGAQYILRARVIDTSSWDNTKVDSEGTIVRRENGKKTLAAMGLAAGGPMAAGAVIAGVPGAVIGAGVGAGVGTVIWLKQDRQAQLPKDLGLVFSLTEPMSVTPVNAAATPEKVPTPGAE